ncbi:MAG TPA: GFA family protein [Rhizomicrobium sp.]|jgi:hypothetical protein
MTKIVRKASCSCGQLRVTVTGDPVRISICHCFACQKRTSSLFGAQARWPRQNVTIEGPSTAWRRTGDEGSTGEFHFCPVCGTTVWYIAPVDGDTIAVATGCFSDPDFPKPQYSVYDNRRHRWLKIPDGIEID